MEQEILDQIGKLFTFQQQAIFAIITLTVIGATQAFKNIYFGFHNVKKRELRKAIIWLFAVSFGLLGGMVGHITSTVAEPLWFWIFTGIMSSGASIGIFNLFVKKIMPRLFGKPKES